MANFQGTRGLNMRQDEPLADQLHILPVALEYKGGIYYFPSMETLQECIKIKGLKEDEYRILYKICVCTIVNGMTIESVSYVPKKKE